MNIIRSSILKNITGAIALIAAMGFASQASAYTFSVCEAAGFNSAPDVNDFLNGTPTPNTSSGTASCTAPAGTNTGVEWFPNSVPTSSINASFTAFDLFLDLTLDQDMAMDFIGRITQINNEIFQVESIGGAQGFPYTHTMGALGEFKIVDEAGTNVTAGFPPASFDITHTETLNSGPCATNFTGTICEDTWDFNIVPPPGFSFDFFTADAPGFKFTGSFDLVPGPGVVIIGNTVYTPETLPGESFIDVKVTIASMRVPEPGTLALFGLGLAGLGFAARRKQG